VRRRLFFVLGAASVTGLLTSFLVYRAIIRIAPRGEGTVEVVVASLNMGLGETVTRKHVRLSPWPKTDVPQGAFKSLAEVEGWVARSSIVTGEPLLKAKLLNPELAGRGGLLPMLVPEGLRGVTIKVDKAVQESGFVHPNSHVDVVVSIGKGRGSRIAKVVLQNVLVLAAGQTVEMHDNKPVKVTTVTLALSPEQVEKLVLAQSEGRLMLATRNLHDDRTVRTTGVTQKGLLGQASSTPKPEKARVSDPAPLRPPKVKRHAVSVLRGGSETDYNFVRGKNEPWSLVGPGPRR
jgi:pilus assembly protein CpaB